MSGRVLDVMEFKNILILACFCAASVLASAQNGAANNAPNKATQIQQLGSGSDASRNPGDALKNQPPAAAADATYVIGPADVLSVQVWHEPDLSAHDLPVRPDGKISIALLNDIQAAGLTPMQLGDEITKGLKKYVSDPQVTVVVDAINSKRIYVMGQVQRPGAYPLLPEMSVLQALSGAGGFVQYANPKKTYVLRGATKLPFSYNDALRGKHLDQQPILQAGDTVVVP